MPKFKILLLNVRYSKWNEDEDAWWDDDASDIEAPVSSGESEDDTDWETDEDEDTDMEDSNVPTHFEGDSLYTLFDEPVRLFSGRNVKRIKCMKLCVSKPKQTLPMQPSPLVNQIVPVSYYTAMDFGWQRSPNPGFKVFQDRTFAVRDSRAGTSNAIFGDVGFRRGIHRWKIRWNPNERGMHPVIGVGTSSSRLKSNRYEPLISDKHGYGWHLKKCCLLHAINYHRQQPFIAYPGVEFRDINQKFNVPEEITVVLDMEIGTLSFFVEETFLGVAFQGLKGLKLFPMLSTTWGQAKVQIVYEGGIYPQPDPLMHYASKQFTSSSLKALSQMYSFPRLLFENSD